MKASVVIANFNNEKYIAQCINSLKSQTYKDLEIIFFDDNSSDNSLDIIKKFSDVKVIENKKQTNFGSLNQLNAFKHEGFWQPMDTLREKNILDALWNENRAPWKKW